MAIPMMAFNVKNFEKKVNLWKSGMDPSYNFHDFSHKNDNLGLKMKVLKFLGIHPNFMFSNESWSKMLNFLNFHVLELKTPQILQVC